MEKLKRLDDMQLDRTALMLVDMQNDFLHPDGAFSRHGQMIPASRALTEQLIKATNAVRDAKGQILSAQFTLVADNNSQPIIPEPVEKAHPFLSRGDFQLGRWGHFLIDELKPANYEIHKISYSAFYNTYLDWLLDRLDIDTLILGGIMTNTSISATLMDAQSRGYKTTLLADGCAALDNTIHNNALDALSEVTEVKTCKEVANLLQHEEV